MGGSRASEIEREEEDGEGRTGCRPQAWSTRTWGGRGGGSTAGCRGLTAGRGGKSASALCRGWDRSGWGPPGKREDKTKGERRRSTESRSSPPFLPPPLRPAGDLGSEGRRRTDSELAVVALVLAQPADGRLDLVRPRLDEVVVAHAELAVAASVGVDLGNRLEGLKERGLGADPRGQPDR